MKKMRAAERAFSHVEPCRNEYQAGDKKFDVEPKDPVCTKAPRN